MFNNRDKTEKIIWLCVRFVRFLNKPVNMTEVDVAKRDENNDEVSIEEILKPFPPGPLTPYRKNASFDWRKMKLFLEGEDIVRFKVCINNCAG